MYMLSFLLTKRFLPGAPSVYVDFCHGGDARLHMAMHRSCGPWLLASSAAASSLTGRNLWQVAQAWNVPVRIANDLQICGSYGGCWLMVE